MLFCISFASVFSVLLVMAPAALSGTHTMTTQENLLPCKTHDQECSQHSPTIQKHLKEVCQSKNTYGRAAPIITPRKSACTESLQCPDVAADLQPFAHQWLDISSFAWHGQSELPAHLWNISSRSQVRHFFGLSRYPPPPTGRGSCQQSFWSWRESCA